MHERAAPTVFSPGLRKLRLERAASKFAEHAFIHERVVNDAIDRLETVQKTFSNALLYGPAAVMLQNALTEKAAVENVQIAGESGAFLKAQGASDPIEAAASALPFADNHFDLLVSLMSLHAENDLPKALSEAKRVLQPDGLLIASFPAETTLAALRTALRDAEADATGGVSPRVLPFVQIKDGGSLLQRAGFALPVVDTQPIRVRYREPLRLLKDLRGMGETQNLARGPRGALRRDVLGPVLARLHGEEILFEVLVMTGWTPHPSQPKPLKPGSAKASLADAIAAQPEKRNDRQS